MISPSTDLPGERRGGEASPEHGGPGLPSDTRIGTDADSALAASLPVSPSRRFLGLTVRLLLTLVVTWFIIRALGVNLQELKRLEWNELEPGWGLLALSAGILLLGYLYSAGLWGLMVREMGGPRIPLLPAQRIFFTANLGRYIPGKLWQIAGLALLARREGVPAATATGAAVLGQLFSLGGATLVGLGVLLDWEGLGGLEGEWVAAGLLGLLFLATFPRILRPALLALLRKAGAGDPDHGWPSSAFGVRWLSLYAVSWAIQGGAFMVFLTSFGVKIGFVQGLAVFPTAYLLGYIAFFAPAGLGVREGSLIFFLTPLAGPMATVLAVLARLWTTVVELVPALLLAGGFMRGSRPKNGAGGQGG